MSVLRSLWTVFIALSLLGAALLAHAEQVPDSGSGGDRRGGGSGVGEQSSGSSASSSKISYAQEYSELKEKISARDEKIADKKNQIEISQRDLQNLKKYEKYSEDDKTSVKYSAKCDCSPKNQCTVKALKDAGAITDDQLTWSHIDLVKGGCADDKPSATADASGSAKPPSGSRTGDYVDGSGGPDGKKDKCKQFQVFADDVDAAAVCTAVYNYAKDNDRGSGSTLNRTCVEKARACGAVKYLVDKDQIPKDIAALQADLDKLQKDQSKDIARRDSIKQECPHCTSVADAVDSDKPSLGDYIVGGLQAVMPVVGQGIQAHSYNQYLKTNLSAQNAYYNSVTSNCQAYISQGTTLGVTSSPCSNAAWVGGNIQAPTANYGTYAGAYTGASGYASGYGAYGYGTSAMYGASMGAYGTYGSSIGAYGASMGMYGTTAAMYGSSIGAYGSSYGTYGAAYGAGYSAAAYGTYGSTYGAGYSAAAYGTYGSTYGTAQLQSTNLQLSQQQVTEAQYRYSQIAAGSSYGASYGTSYGATYGAAYGTYGTSYGSAYGTYGYPSATYGYPTTAYGTSLGSVIGSVYGLPY